MKLKMEKKSIGQRTSSLKIQIKSTNFYQNKRKKLAERHTASGTDPEPINPLT